MWCPSADLEEVNRLIVRLEAALLAVMRRTASPRSITESDWISELFAWVDAHPYQAFCLTRIKSGHAMTPRHGINVMLTARAWAFLKHNMGTKLDAFSYAALFHDLGHWSPDDLVYVFDNFSFEEWDVLSEHTEPHPELTSLLGEDAVGWIRDHHEQPDGKGYPRGITDPSLPAQAIRIVDCFEGLTTPRRIRPAYEGAEALRLMGRWVGYKYHPGLFRGFQRFLGTFPVGSFVKLVAGPLAITLPSPSADNDAVLVLTNQDADPLAEPEVREIDLSEIKAEIKPRRETELKGAWRRLRPDLMGLPRAYA